MKLGKYGMKLKNYLENHKPLYFQKLVMNGTIMDFLNKEEREIVEYSYRIEKELKEKYVLENKTSFEEVVKYNRMIESIREEFVDEFIYNLV